MTASLVAGLPRIDGAAVRQLWRDGREIALIDVRDEHAHAQGHPLFAAQLELADLADEAPWRLPRRGVPIVLLDDAGRDDGPAAAMLGPLRALGHVELALLDGGIAGWTAGGGELFADVNSPSKAFGELVEHERGTPSLPAESLWALQSAGADLVVLDARRFDEYRTMAIPGGISVPGGELLLRARALAPDPRTRIVVNCAGRTRSLIGAQTLINGGLPNPVAALRNGTIGWTLAGLPLARGLEQRFDTARREGLAQAQQSARALARRAGAVELTAAELARWQADGSRTLYRWDVRDAAEYAAGHLPGFGHAPGGQLVQETDFFAAVRGARIALVDGGPRHDGVRAPVTAHWLAQMGWEVGWLAEVEPSAFSETGAWVPAQRRRATRRYQRPYEGTAASAETMQAYLDWEYGLVAQLARDGTHRFHVLQP